MSIFFSFRSQNPNKNALSCFQVPATMSYGGRVGQIFLIPSHCFRIPNGCSCQCHVLRCAPDNTRDDILRSCRGINGELTESKKEISQIHLSQFLLLFILRQSSLSVNGFTFLCRQQQLVELKGKEWFFKLLTALRPAGIFTISTPFRLSTCMSQYTFLVLNFEYYEILRNRSLYYKTIELLFNSFNRTFLFIQYLFVFTISFVIICSNYSILILIIL